VLSDGHSLNYYFKSLGIRWSIGIAISKESQEGVPFEILPEQKIITKISLGNKP
jgi:hypothetical protein